MKIYSFIFTLLLSAVLTTPADAAGEVKVAWVFQKPSAKAPHGSLALNVNGKTVPVRAADEAPYQALLKSEFSSYKLPAKALLGAFSWHAGFGDLIYVLKKSDSLEVYRQEMDESEGDPYPLRKILIIRLQ